MDQVIGHASADRYLVAVAKSLRAVAAGDLLGGRAALVPIAGELWDGMPPWDKPSIPRPQLAERRAQRTSFSNRRAAEIFLRDNFACRYCGQRLVPVCLLSALSQLYPIEVPYVSTYKRGSIHSLYWLIGAEADHIVPGTRGGDWDDPNNHATACVLCNTRKSDWTLQELGWQLRPPAASVWDGGLPSYLTLWQASGQPHAAYHEGWLRAFGIDPRR